jgi:hypothetical protein
VRRILLLTWLALVGVQLALGVVWIARNGLWVPDYGDTGKFIQLARTLEVDTYRGIGYPALLAGIARIPGAEGVLRSTGGVPMESARLGVLLLKSFQLLASAGAIVYFLRVLSSPVGTPAGPRRARVGGAVLLFLLLFLDPLVAHFNLAVMTDGLALSGSLVFVAALAAFGLGTRRGVSGFLVVLALVCVASLRVEKLAVMGCATLATLVVWRVLQRGVQPAERTFTGRRALEVVGLLAAGALAVTGLQRFTRADSEAWPLADNLVHSRIVFPHLSDVYAELPEDVRKRLTPALARKHDTNPVVGYRVINDITGVHGRRSREDREAAPDSNARPTVAPRRQAMLREMAAIVLRERWPLLVADVAKDALENAAATASWYVRLAILAQRGEVSPADGAQKTYQTLAAPDPRLSRGYVSASAALFLVSAALAAATLVRRVRTGGTGLDRRRVLAWVPAAMFVLVNACAFALRADMVHVRYLLLAHVVTLALVYRGALDFLAGGASRR